MRTLILSQLFLIAAMIGSPALASSQLQTGVKPPPIEKVVSMTQVFMQERQSANSEVFAVVSGLFPNGCYVYQRPEVRFEKAEKIYQIRNIALVHQGMCIMVIVPFNQQIKFGKLSRGKHNFQFLNGDGTYIYKSVIVE